MKRLTLAPYGTRLAKTVVAGLALMFAGLGLAGRDESVAASPARRPWTYQVALDPPSEASVRRVAVRRYEGLLKVTSLSLDGPHRRTGPSPEGSPTLVLEYGRKVQLEFIADGWETHCTHQGSWKLFGTQPYQSPYAGHVCSNEQKKTGDRAEDEGPLTFTLERHGWRSSETQEFICGDGLCP